MKHRSTSPREADVADDGFVAKFWEEATQASTSRLSVNLG